MFFFLAWPLMALGLALCALGGRLLWTGRNFSGILGRGFTQSNEIRMQRAPASFFRTLGVVASVPGALLLFFGVVFAIVPNHPDKILAAIVSVVGGLLFSIEVAAVIWLLQIAARNRLFRWDKP